jgi:hypothetical protein
MSKERPRRPHVWLLKCDNFSIAALEELELSINDLIQSLRDDDVVHSIELVPIGKELLAKIIWETSPPEHV